MCIFLQIDQIVHHLYLSTFTYSLGACSLQCSCLVCTCGLHTASLFPKLCSNPDFSKAEARGRLSTTSWAGEMIA